MKQLLFLILFPCLCVAQYTGNAGQKITLGEQTTADGLVFRGRLADTANLLTNKLDTSVYIVLDTGTRAMWYYRASTTPKWTRLVDSLNNMQGQLSLTTKVTGTLPVANGGTGASVRTFVDTINTQTVNGAKTFTSAVTGARFNPTGSTVTGTGMFLPAPNTIGLSANSVNQQTLHPNGMTIFKPTPQNLSTLFRLIEIGAQGSIYSAPGDPGTYNDYTFALGYYWDASGNAKYMNTETNITHQPIKLTLYQGAFRIDNAVVGTKDSIITFTRLLTLNELGKLGIGESDPAEKLHVVGNARITGAYTVTTGSAANVFVTTDGVLQRSTSSIKYKTDVEDYSKGLKEVMQLRPVTFKSINSNNDKTYAGFIAEELADLKLNELVENNDSGEPDAISYAYMVTLLTKAIQEQQEQISLLKKRLLILENK